MEFFKIGLNYIDEEKITSILDENKTCPLFFLGNEIADKDGFYRDIRDNFPLDPPLLGNSVNWDALADSLWGGIFNLEKSNVFFVWRGHKKMQENDRKSYLVATEVLTSIANTLSEPKYTSGRPVDLFILISN